MENWKLEHKANEIADTINDLISEIDNLEVRLEDVLRERDDLQEENESIKDQIEYFIISYGVLRDRLSFSR
jgi:FtsZ-binding cell division protein ZapB